MCMGRLGIQYEVDEIHDMGLLVIMLLSRRSGSGLDRPCDSARQVRCMHAHALAKLCNLLARTVSSYQGRCFPMNQAMNV